jgi:hypothetical protein
MGMTVVGKTANLTGKRTGRVQEPFKFNAGYYVRVLSKAVLGKGVFRYTAKTG